MNKFTLLNSVLRRSRWSFATPFPYHQPANPFNRTYSEGPKRDADETIEQKQPIEKADLNAGASRAYVSKHFCLEGNEVITYLNRRSMPYRLTQDKIMVETCPFCHDTKDLPDNQYKLAIYRGTGGFNCLRCQSKGSWYDFRNRISHGEHDVQPIETVRDHLRPTVSDPIRVSEELPALTPAPSASEQQKREANLWSPSFAKVRDYLRQTRGLDENTLRKYGVGACEMNVLEGSTWRRDQCMTFPMYDGGKRLVRVKARSVRTKSGMQLLPKGGRWGFFGLNTVPEDATEVVLTEGELDAMSVWQSTGRPAISLPNGAQSLPVQLIPFLERVPRIVLWMDADDAGRAGAKQFAGKLGLKRCRVVQLGALQKSDGCKDANDVLRSGKDMRDVVRRADVLPHDGVVRFDALRESVFDFIVNQGIRRGVQCGSLPKVNEILKGHRRGELTILSGHTGIGKTTLLSQLSLDYCLQGVTTMWGSFEIGNVRLASTLLLQMFGALGGHGNLVDNYDKWADRLSELPMLFMKYHGSNSMDVVMDAMEWGNYMYDCSHFILDNLQFMTYGQSMGRGNGGGGSKADRFEVMDDAVGRLRQLATSKHCHVTLVVHPRKENDQEAIQLASIFGSAKATQEADNVLLLQRGREGIAQLEVKKNRFDGECGFVSLKFDKQFKLFRQSDRGECRMQMSIGGLEMRGVDEGAKERGNKTVGTESEPDAIQYGRNDTQQGRAVADSGEQARDVNDRSTWPRVNSKKEGNGDGDGNDDDVDVDVSVDANQGVSGVFRQRSGVGKGGRDGGDGNGQIIWKGVPK